MLSPLSIMYVCVCVFVDVCEGCALNASGRMCVCVYVFVCQIKCFQFHNEFPLFDDIAAKYD